MSISSGPLTRATVVFSENGKHIWERARHKRLTRKPELLYVLCVCIHLILQCETDGLYLFIYNCDNLQLSLHFALRSNLRSPEDGKRILKRWFGY